MRTGPRRRHHDGVHRSDSSPDKPRERQAMAHDQRTAVLHHIQQELRTFRKAQPRPQAAGHRSE